MLKKFFFNSNINLKILTEGKMSNILVVYFSKAGEQYAVGNIQEGNTAIIAKIIAHKLKADTFEIKVVNDNYPQTYNELIRYAQKEKRNKERPEIVDNDINIDKYDTIFIGYPNWWGDMPMPVYTFTENHDLKTKNVYYFCTHEGSGGVHKNDFAIHGHIAQNDRIQTEKSVSIWLKGLSL